MTKLRRTADVPRTLAAMALLLLLAAAVAPVAAQQDDLPAVFSEVIDVRVVNIEVVVTDKQGNRIHDLVASDFELLVDGEPTPIDYFTEIAEGLARETAEADVAGVAGVRTWNRIRRSARASSCSSTISSRSSATAIG